MKHFVFILFLSLVGLLRSQEVDTVYTDDERVEISLDIDYYNCYYVTIDTNYRLITYTTDPEHRKLFHATTKQLLLERWVSNDTSYCFEYYPSGAIKVKDWSIENHWLHHSVYYENGQLKSGGGLFPDKLYPSVCYYPDGKIKSKAMLYGYFQQRFGHYEEYHPNGKLATSKNYSLPDTSTINFQQAVLLNEENFDPNGKKIIIDSSAYYSVFQTIHVFIRPGSEEYNTLYNTSVTPIYQQSEISGENNLTADQRIEIDKVTTEYEDNLEVLKQAILSNLKLPKKCDCSTGVAWIGLTISGNGSFRDITIDFPDQSVRARIKAAIDKTGPWNISKMENLPIAFHIFTYLVLDQAE